MDGWTEQYTERFDLSIDPRLYPPSILSDTTEASCLYQPMMSSFEGLYQPETEAYEARPRYSTVHQDQGLLESADPMQAGSAAFISNRYFAGEQNWDLGHMGHDRSMQTQDWDITTSHNEGPGSVYDPTVLDMTSCQDQQFLLSIGMERSIQLFGPEFSELSLQTQGPGLVQNTQAHVRLAGNNTQAHRRIRSFRVRRVGEQRFVLAGQSLQSAIIQTRKLVSDLTGVSIMALQHAKEETEICWGTWLVTKLSKTNPSCHADTGPRQVADITRAKSHTTVCDRIKTTSHHDLDTAHVESTHSECSQIHAHRYHGTIVHHESMLGDTSASGIDIVSAGLNNTVSGPQSLKPKGSEKNVEEALLSAKSQQHLEAEPVFSSTRRSEANNRRGPVSKSTRARQSFSSANAKLYRVERLDNTRFKHNGKWVKSATVQTIKPLSVLIGFDDSSIRRALRKKGSLKGVVNKDWKVKDLGKVNPSA